MREYFIEVGFNQPRTDVIDEITKEIEKQIGTRVTRKEFWGDKWVLSWESEKEPPEKIFYTSPEELLTKKEKEKEVETMKGIYERAEPWQKVGLHATTFFSPKGWEYVFSYLPGGKTPEQVVHERMAEIARAKEPPLQYAVKTGLISGVMAPTGTIAIGLLGGVGGLVKALGAGAISTGVGAGVRLITGGEPLKEEELGLDFMTGTLMGGIGNLIYPYVFSPLTHGAVRALAGGIFGFSGTYLRDVAQDLMRGEAPKVDYSAATYITSTVTGAVLAYGIPKLQTAIEEGKIGLVKPGFVRSKDETWIGLYHEKGTKVNPIAGIMIRRTPDGFQIDIGRNLEFMSFVPGKTPFKSPIEYFLSKRAEDKYYSDLLRAGKLKGWTAEQLKLGREIVEDVYIKTGKETLKLTLTDVVNAMERLKVIDKTAFLNILHSELRKGRIMIYGSAADLLQTGFTFRSINDMDIQILEGSAKDFVNKILKAYPNEITAKLKPDGSGYELYNKFNEKIMEVFEAGYDRLFGEKYIGYGFRTLLPQKTEEGYIMQLKEQFARKFTSAFTPQKEGLAPEVWRIKDNVDLVKLAIYYKNQYPFLASKVEKFLSTITPEQLKEMLQAMDKVVMIEFVIGPMKYYGKPSEFYPFLAAQLSSPIASSRIGQIAQQYFSQKPSKPSQPQSQSSLPAPSKPSPSKPSYKPYSLPSYSYSVPSYSYSVPSYSPSKSSYSPKSASSSSPSASKSLSQASQVPSIYPYMSRAPFEFSPPAPRIVVPTKWVSELQYI